MIYLYDLNYHGIVLSYHPICDTGELGYDRLNGTRKIGPSYAKSVIYI